jgi:hypothetical protein
MLLISLFLLLEKMPFQSNPILLLFMLVRLSLSFSLGWFHLFHLQQVLLSFLRDEHLMLIFVDFTWNILLVLVIP